jgi:hypothetical protein
MPETTQPVIPLRSFGGPWSGSNNDNDKDEVHVMRDHIWIGTRRGGMSIHGRKTMRALADAIYEVLGDG